MLFVVAVISILAAIALPKFILIPRGPSYSLEFDESHTTPECIQQSAVAVLTDENFKIAEDWGGWESGVMLQTEALQWKNRFMPDSFMEEVKLNAVFRKKKGTYGLLLQTSDSYKRSEKAFAVAFDRAGEDKLRATLTGWGKDISSLSLACSTRREMPQLKFKDPPTKLAAVRAAVKKVLNDAGFELHEPEFDDIGRFETAPKIVSGMISGSNRQILSASGQVVSTGGTTWVAMAIDGTYVLAMAPASTEPQTWPPEKRDALIDMRDKMIRAVRTNLEGRLAKK
jgi:hypothetical protein